MMNDPFQLPSSSFYRQEYRGIHPLSSSPSSATINTNSNSNNITTSMNSPPTSNGAGLFFEQVTTIFVVGFPEDMHEREFQNMFMFSPGFMGASLKWNCKDQDDDSATFSASTTNFSMTIPETTGVMTSPASMNGKKQMIGFAKFRSRLEALEAVDVISGKKIDQGSDITLKAEIAKKNLHIKHGSTAPIANATPMDTTASSSSTSSSSSSSSVSSSSLRTTNDQSNRNNNTSTGSTSGIDKAKNMMLGYHDFFTFSPLPSDLLSPMVDYKADPFESNTTADHHPHHLQQSHSMTPTTPVFNDNLFAFRSYSIDGRNSNSRVFGGDGMDSNSNNNALGIAPRSSISSITSFTQQMSIKQPQNSHFSVPDDPSLDPFYYLSKSSPAPVDRFDAYGLNGPTTTGPMGMNGFGSTATVGKATPPLRSNPAYPQRSNSVMMQPTSTNLADQNPPCNTLYVGNLPSNTIEDELRQLFSKCTGYKRMYFRTKPQGPMCFVEFDDVIYATQTMSDLQGQALSNSLKGGIRLSFSKNPLFIKPQHRSASRPFDPPL